MTADPHIRAATPADLPAMLDLMRVSLGEGTVPRTAEFWRWKHEANPFGRSPVLIAEADGSVVGLRAFMRWTWRVGNRSVPAVRAVDTATHPEYRGRGVFKRLTLALRDEMEAAGVAFIYNTPNTLSRPGYLKMGWRLVGRPTLWVRPVRPLRLAAALYRERLTGEEGEPPQVEAESAGVVLRKPAVRSLLESLAATVSERYHTAPAPRYLQWRYADIPDFSYHAMVRGSGPEAALVVMRSRRRGALRELRLCDVVAGPTPAGRRNTRALLLQVARRADVDVVVTMLPEGFGMAELLSAGYLPAHRMGPVMTAYAFPASRGLPDPRQLLTWAPMIGDLELF